ncbi:putative signal peptidase II [Clostridium argentinense CDC 2741]|uniref:Putative signal peptidase II n=1 Tax=Clostridium argentinense CDC 2741 TaxID=1418104 RepID=A0A0C1R0Z2_9CLOT|nr:hypothetical protein [Clostridium argentinense]ARC85630.1 signal peptidase II [Clostridium argentinense]KIE47037.1 putative signal peptidase II [Clostridium argentinense CDC 2741]NFF40849.1 signal peptidase II [Clostridium argentinense]NFP50781.1 signal peptidase II [Clostridium argentinense]NFP73062.1 signal peptidase II [Clostridium argentinense]
MSEFFNVVLDKDVVLDDSIISNKLGWTSEKIYKEIINKRITKFEELEDVDVVSKQDKQLVAYSEDTGKFTTIDSSEAGEITGVGLKQISKMGIVGSPTEPRIINISINTIDFKVPRVNVLRMDDGDKGIIVTKNSFTNGENNDFEADKYIQFDGKAYLKTEYYEKCDLLQDTSEGTEYMIEIDFDEFKSIEGLQFMEDGVMRKLKIKAIPHDRLLIPKGDMNLSNVRNIDYFKINGKGINIRIVCSADGGKTWKTFKSEKWVNINLELENVREKGMTIDLFNSINGVFWNELVTTKRIRFAYLFCIDTIDDVEELDELLLQYDSEGKWLQAKEDTFDVVYASNTLLQVFVKFSGDIKINY